MLFLFSNGSIDAASMMVILNSNHSIRHPRCDNVIVLENTFSLDPNTKFEKLKNKEFLGSKRLIRHFYNVELVGELKNYFAIFPTYCKYPLHSLDKTIFTSAFANKLIDFILRSGISRYNVQCQTLYVESKKCWHNL